MRKTIQNEKGFVLAVAILAMVVVGAAVVAGYFVANQEYRIGKSVRESTTAFYAAQGGLQREFANWPIQSRWTMDGGQTLNVGPVTYPNGTAYGGTITRVDNVPESDTDSERYYLVQLTGRAPAPLVGEEIRNRQSMLLRVRYYDFCCSAAIQAKDSLLNTGSATISGVNTTPTGWAGQCDSASTADVAGVEVECTDCFEEGGSATTTGSPASQVDTSLQSQTLTEWDEVNFDFLKSKASKVYAHGDVATPTAPATIPDPITGLPTCDRSVKPNWGAPEDPTHTCFSYFPIIYAEGDLELAGNTSGQGLLVVEGDLFFKGTYRFYGIVLVKGHLLLEGTGALGAGPKITGSAVIAGQTFAGDTFANSRVSGNARIDYSACAVSRAKRFAELARKEPLPLRAWSEALN